MNLVVTANGSLTAGDTSFRAASGRGGISAAKQEGDGTSPAGLWPLRRVLYRADRLARPETNLPLSLIQRDDGWCDAPADPAYNTMVKLPYPASHEDCGAKTGCTMWWW